MLLQYPMKYWSHKRHHQHQMIQINIKKKSMDACTVSRHWFMLDMTMRVWRDDETFFTILFNYVWHSASLNVLFLTKIDLSESNFRCNHNFFFSIKFPFILFVCWIYVYLFFMLWKKRKKKKFEREKKKLNFIIYCITVSLVYRFYFYSISPIYIQNIQQLFLFKYNFTENKF